MTHARSLTEERLLKLLEDASQAFKPLMHEQLESMFDSGKAIAADWCALIQAIQSQGILLAELVNVVGRLVPSGRVVP